MNPDGTLPAEFQDEVVHILSKLGVSGYINLVIDYPERLDEARLTIALRRLLDAEPVLGCRFCADAARPVWRRREGLEEMAHCLVREDDNRDESTAQLLAERFVVHRSPNISVALIRSPQARGDRLLLRVSHVIADGAAAFDVAKTLTDLYTRLGSDSDYQPSPNTASRNSFLWLKDFTLKDKLKLLLLDLKSLPAALGSRRGLISDAKTFAADLETVQPGYRALRLDEPRLAALDAYAEAHQATLNDIFLAAFFRAFDVFCPSPAGVPLEVVMPTNMRRYAPLQRRPAIRNLSGITYIRIGTDVGASFVDTLGKIRQETLRHKRRLLGTEGQLMTTALARASYARKQQLISRNVWRSLKKPAPPVLTNVGQVRAHQFACDGVSPTDLAMFGEASPSPVFLCVMVRMDDRLSFTVSHDQRLGAGRIDAFLKRLDQSLPGAERTGA